jgi:hypothetical protein
VDLSQRYEETVQQHYRAEIHNIEEALLLAPSIAPEARDIGLRIALLTHASDDAVVLKRELTIRLFLDTLLDKGPLTPEQLNGIIAAQLHLPRTPSVRYTREVLSQAVHDNLVYFEGDTIHLTSSGVETAKTIPAEAGSRLLEGRTAVREAVQRLSGYTIGTLGDTQFERFWDAFQDGITSLFTLTVWPS